MNKQKTLQLVVKIIIVWLLTTFLSSGILFGQATIGGKIYSGRNLTGWIPNLTGTNTGASTGAIYYPDPLIAPVSGATVMVQNQHSGGGFITYGTVVGNTWSATIPAADLPGDFVVMVSAPGHDHTSREFSVDAGGLISHPTFDPNYDPIGSPETFDLYLPPLFTKPDGTADPANELPLANLLAFTFYDNLVNGEPDDFPEDLPLNGVVWYLANEEGDTLAVGVSGSQSVINLAGGGVITNTMGLYYFTSLTPGEVIATTSPDYIYLAGDPSATAVDVGWGPPLDFSTVPKNEWLMPDGSTVNYGWSATSDFYLNYTEEGGRAWDPKLFPGDPGTEAGGFLIWHSYIEKLDQITAGNVVDRFGPGATLAGAASIAGILQDSDAPNLDPIEPYPQRDLDNPGVSLNRVVENGLIILFGNSELAGVRPVATVEPDEWGVFEFKNVPPGNYKMQMFDTGLNYVWSQTQVTVAPSTDVVMPPIALLAPRFGARGQGYVYDHSTGLPVPGAVVHIRYKDGSIQMTEITDANGWYNFDFLPEIEVMGYVDVELPNGYRGHMRTERFYPIGRGPNAMEDRGFDNIAGTGDPGEGNGFLDCEDINGNGILDEVLPGVFLEDTGLDHIPGTFDAGEGNGVMDCEDVGLDGLPNTGDTGEYNGLIDPNPAPACGVDLTLAGVPVVCEDVSFNAMSRYVQWLTANYRADLYIEPIPGTVGHINGFVFNDHLKRFTPPSTYWSSDGIWQPEEERTLHGVTIELWDATMTTLIADTTTGKFDKAATMAQGWRQPYTWPPDEFGGVHVGPQVGYYEFRDVAPGDYVVKVIPPTGYSPSDVLHPVGEATVTVSAGARKDVDFGLNTLAPLAGEIEGGVFDDVFIDNRGGIFTPDPGDPTSLLFAEKAGVPGAPVGVYDHLGYNLGLGIMGNPLCFSGAPDSLNPDGSSKGVSQCPAGEDPIQKPEMERRFAPGVHIYAGNDPAFPGYCANYLPLVLPYTFGQGKFKFEADWSLVPASIPLPPGCNNDPFILFTEPIIIDPFAPLMARGIGKKGKGFLAASSPSVTLNPGDDYRVQGSGFGDAQGYQTVTLAGRKLHVEAWTDTYIDVIIPGDAISGPIVVTTTTGHSNALQVEINYNSERADHMERHSVFVDVSNTGPEDGSEEHPYNTIGEALENLPHAPRFVYVAPGTYNETVHIKNDGVILIGSGPHETIINGLPRMLNIYFQGASSGEGPVIFIGKGGKSGAVEDISISGFSITGGTVNSDDIGCGIFGDYGNREIDINTCRIYQNGGYYGGGIWLHYSNHDVDIWSNVIAENGNFGGYGGGISVNDEPEYDDLPHMQPEHTVDDYTPGPPPGTYKIYNNIIFHNWSADLGGGICLYEIKDHLKLYGNVLLENKSEDHGAGMFFEDCGPVDIYGNAFIRNWTPDDGGAVSFEDVADTLSHINIWNNLFAENIADDHAENTARGGAIAFDDVRDASIFNNTFVGNLVMGTAKPAGGAIDSERHGHEYNGTDGVYMAPGYSDPKIFNNIFWDNWRVEYVQPILGGEEEDLDYTWGRDYIWTPDQLHVDNPHLQPEWEKYNNSNSFSYVHYNDIQGGYNYNNQPPVADAGADQTVLDLDNSGVEQVTLDASGSSDPDNSIVSYAWSEGGAPIASGANPTVELTTGPHTIFLSVHDERGASSTDVVSVTVMPSSVSFTTTDDAFVRSRRKNRNFGSKTTVRVKKSSTYYSFFKFNVTGLGGAVLSAKIRLKVRNGSDDGGSMYTVSDNGWDEGSITWNNAPSISGSPLSSVGNVSEDDVVEFDVTSAISGDGVYSFGMKSGSNDIARYSSKEGATPPELVIERSAGGGGGNTPPVADAGPDQTVTDSDDSGFEDVTLDGSGSSDPDGTIASYEWKEGATVIATGVGPTVSLAVGSHTLLLTVTDNMGDTAVDVVEVNVNPGSSGDDVAFTPTDDAYVRSKKPTKKYGHSDQLQVRRTSKKSYTFLKFNVTGLSGIVQSAKIRLKVTDSSNDGGTIYTVSNAWDEGSIIWNNAPSIGGSPLSSVGSVSNGDIVEFDVSSAISGNGVYSFGIKSASKNKAEYSSKEGVTAPELVIALAAPPPMLTVASNGALMIDGLGLMTFMKTGLSSYAGKKGIKLGKDSNGHVISGNDNLDVDPQFEDPSALNWRLQAGSPVIDKAKADIGPEVDLELLPRSENNDMIDIGAFERRVNSPIVLRIPTGILGQFPIPTPGSSRLYP